MSGERIIREYHAPARCTNRRCKNLAVSTLFVVKETATGFTTEAAGVCGLCGGELEEVE